VRKVMVFAHETALAPQIACERVVVAPTKPNPDVMRLNPLNKLPTLILDDGTVLYDSRVIVEYLDTVHSGPKLIPPSGPQRIAVLKIQALCDGILDFLLLGLSERARPEAQQSPELKSALSLKFNAAFDRLELEAPRLGQRGFGLAEISVAVVAGYADFRYAANDWRQGRPELAAFVASVAQRPSILLTAHVDAY
jgi:glutathione S-transferase